MQGTAPDSASGQSRHHADDAITCRRFTAPGPLIHGAVVTGARRAEPQAVVHAKILTQRVACNTVGRCPPPRRLREVNGADIRFITHRWRRVRATEAVYAAPPSSSLRHSSGDGTASSAPVAVASCHLSWYPLFFAYEHCGAHAQTLVRKEHYHHTHN